MGHFKEPSTYAGLGVVVAALAPVLGINPDTAWVANGLAALLGGLAVWLRERPAK